MQYLFLIGSRAGCKKYVNRLRILDISDAKSSLVAETEVECFIRSEIADKSEAKFYFACKKEAQLWTVSEWSGWSRCWKFRR